LPPAAALLQQVVIRGEGASFMHQMPAQDGMQIMLMRVGQRSDFQ